MGPSLSQVNGTIWHPRPELWALHVSRREPFGLPERVLNTMAGARADAGRLRGARRMNPQRPCTVPPWDLPTVPMALKGPMFEPLQSLSLRVLSVKTSLQVGDLQALSINPACLEFGPNDSKVVLKLVWAQKQTKTTLGYVPKVLSTPFRAQVIPLSASPPPPPPPSPPPGGQPGIPALPRQGPENLHWTFCLLQKVRTAFCWLR